MIKGAVFDMDGLMFDTERLVYEIWQEMLDKDGYNYNLDVFKQTIGLRRDESERFYKSYYGEDFDYNSRKELSRKIHRQKILNEGVPIKKGLIELLEFLKDNGIKLAVATSTSAESAIFMIKTAGVYKYFDAFVCGNDVINGKPHPEVFLTAAERIGEAPESCLAYEDSFNGIKSAYSAGMTTIMVPDYLQPTEEILKMVNCLCNSLDQSIEYVKSKI
ncbi:MAG: HAD family phosphatase [Ruminococcus sp.]|nr:HAD family phosphatase [Ruminococcus sp.]